MRTYRRLMGFLRPYRLQLWGSLVFAWAAMGMTVLIPWLVGRAINAIEDGNKPDLLPLALAILGAAILRMGLTVVRRLVAGQSLAGGRIRPAPALLRPPAEARARLLRQPADRAADVAGDGRPRGDPLLPRLRPDLHHPDPADDRPRLDGDVHHQPAAGGAGADPGAVRRLDRLALQPRLAARPSRRSPSGSPNSPRRPRRTSPGSASSRPSPGRNTSSTASSGRSNGSSTSRSTRPACRPSSAR